MQETKPEPVSLTTEKACPLLFSPRSRRRGHYSAKREEQLANRIGPIQGADRNYAGMQANAGRRGRLRKPAVDAARVNE